jgi:competence protein ComEC
MEESLPSIGRKLAAGFRQSIALGIALVVSTTSALALGDGKVHVYVCDVGQGSGSIIIGPTGLSCLVDGGASNGIAPNLIEAMNDAIAAGLTDNTLDYSIVSHLHTDHLSAMDEVLAAFPGGLIAAYDRTGTYSSGAFTNYNNAYGSKRAAPTTFSLGSSATMTYLGRGGGTSSDENNYGVVYRLDFGVFQAWFGGDLGMGYEAAKGATCGKVEFYHVNHHGSSTSSEATFLSYIEPKGIRVFLWRRQFVRAPDLGRCDASGSRRRCAL